MAIQTSTSTVKNSVSKNHNYITWVNKHVYFCYAIMKKAALILLICVYSLATMGFSLRQFYCCGKLKSTTFSLALGEQKSCNKGNEKSGCCDNKYQFFKVKDKHISSDEVDSPAKHFVDLHLYTLSFQDISFASQKPGVAYRSNAPPLHTGVPIYIYNCVFRI